ncbi:2-dehydropantoate 2-reductase [Oceanobacillus sp. HCA-5259]|uniref:ketopantoate reductase family protein n=1 Tax=Oceanobacillus sp. HCA-5259 TaxID=3134661 RepID=UPI0030BF6E8B
MKIGVVGAGAVGGFFGLLLQRAGNQVTFIARGPHLKAMQRDGLLIKRGTTSLSVNGRFSDDLQDLLDCELILFCIKSNDTEQMAKELLPILSEEANVLTLQNGVDNEMVLTQIFGKERTFSCATYIQAAVEQPGVIKQDGRVKLVIGELNYSSTEKCSELVSIFQNAGIDAKHSRNILARKWKKLLWNITFNPLSAISTARVGDILDNEELRKTAEFICQEAIEVAIRTGIKLDREETVTAIFAGGERARAHNPSMLQDRLNGKPMEVEAICGYVVRKARELEVKVPTLQMSYSILNHLNQVISNEKKEEE